MLEERAASIITELMHKIHRLEEHNIPIQSVILGEEEYMVLFKNYQIYFHEPPEDTCLGYKVIRAREYNLIEVSI